MLVHVVTCLATAVTPGTAKYCFQLESPCYWCSDANTTVCGDPDTPPSAPPCTSGWVSWADKYTLCPPVECVTKAGPWSDCTANCGGGTRSRDKQIVIPSSENETAIYMQPCDLKDVVRCNTRPCGPVGRDIRVTTLTVDGVSKRPLKSYYRGWFLPKEDDTQEPRPFYTTPLGKNGALRIAWSWGGYVYLASIDANDKLTAAISKVTGKEARGLTHDAFLTLATNTSMKIYDTALPVQVWAEIDTSIGDSRMATGAGEHYIYSSAYDPANPVTNGDINMVYKQGVKLSSGQWGCAPSSGHQLIYSEFASMAITSCIGGGLPGIPKRLSIFPQGDASGKGRYQDGLRVLDFPSDSSGRVGGEVGPMVAVPNGIVLIFTASNSVKGREDAIPFIGTHSKGENMLLGVAVATYDNITGVWATQPVTWLAVPPSDSLTSPQIAIVGSGLSGGYLAGWKAAGRYYVMRLDPVFQNVSDVEDVTSWAVWGDRNNWVTTPEGDVSWAFSWSYRWRDITLFRDGNRYLKVARYQKGHAEVIDASSDLACQQQASNPQDPVQCSELFSKKQAAGSSSGLPAVVYVLMVVVAVVGLGVLYYFYRRSRRFVGNRRRPKRLYPWDQETASNLEYLEVPKEMG